MGTRKKCNEEETEQNSIRFVLLVIELIILIGILKDQVGRRKIGFRQVGVPKIGREDDDK